MRLMCGRKRTQVRSVGNYNQGLIKDKSNNIKQSNCRQIKNTRKFECSIPATTALQVISSEGIANDYQNQVWENLFEKSVTYIFTNITWSNSLVESIICSFKHHAREFKLITFTLLCVNFALLCINTQRLCERGKAGYGK